MKLTITIEYYAKADQYHVVLWTIDNCFLIQVCELKAEAEQVVKSLKLQKTYDTHKKAA